MGDRKRFLRMIPWGRLSALYAVVSLGISQVAFNLILGNPPSFPRAWSFVFWIVFGFQLVPFAVLAGIETAIVRIGADGRTFRFWRAILYTLTAFSFYRQLGMFFDLAFPGSPIVLAALWLAAAGGLLWLFTRYAASIHRYFSYLGILGLVLLAAFLIGSVPPPPARPDPPRPTGSPPIFLIVFDALSAEILAPDGDVDAERYPNFAALAGDSAWFTDTMTSHDSTDESIPLMLTGSEGKAPLDWLPEDYSVEMILGYSHLEDRLRGLGGYRDGFLYRGRNHRLSGCPFEAIGFILQLLAEGPYVPGRLVRGSWHHLGYEKDHRAFLDTVDAKHAPGRFIYWHCTLPHPEFVHDPDGSVHGRPHRKFFPGSPHAEATLENYRRQVELADRLLGAVIDRLREKGLYDRSVIVVTSDHGLHTEGVLEPEGYPEALGPTSTRIPLILRAPKVSAGPRDAPYQSVDLPAIILGARAGTLPPSKDAERILQTKSRGTYVYDPSTRLWRRREP